MRANDSFLARRNAAVRHTCLTLAALGVLALGGCGVGMDPVPGMDTAELALSSDAGAVTEGADAGFDDDGGAHPGELLPDGGCVVVVVVEPPDAGAIFDDGDLELSGTGCGSTAGGLAFLPLLLVAALLASRRRRSTAGAALIAVSVIAPLSANAARAAGGFSVERFDPAEAGSGFFAADDLSFEGELHPALSLVTDYANAPLAIHSRKTGALEPLVARQLITHLDASFSILDRVRFGASLPVALLTEGHTSGLDGLVYAPRAGFAPGDIRIGADVRLVGQATGAFTLAAGLRVYAPTGSADAFMGDGRVRAGVHLAAAGSVGWLRYAADATAILRPSTADAPGMPLGSGVAFAAALGWQSHGGDIRVGPEFIGTYDPSSTSLVASSGAPAMEAMLGVHAQLGAIRLGLGAGAGLGRGVGVPGWRGLASIDWAPPVHEAPPVRDTDGDGIVDARDACAEVAGDPDPKPERNGCPHPPPDRDRDGIPDALDACPAEPGPQSSDAAKNGCPLPPPDRDRDGVADADDACPDTSGLMTGDPKDNGCPPPDRDHDGVRDSLDACPEKPGNPELDGCPGEDRDGDTVADRLDNCPDEKGAPSNQGCPDAEPQVVALTKERLVLHQQVRFVRRTAKLVAGSEKVLDQVAHVLGNHPELVSVVVEAHAAELPLAKDNLELSSARAEVVVRYLARHGVARTRLQVRGYGSTEPLVPIDGSAEAESQNSRIELRFFAVRR